MRCSSLLERRRRAVARLRMIHHYEQVTRTVSRTCRFIGISRTQFTSGCGDTARRALRRSRIAPGDRAMSRFAFADTSWP